MEALDCLLFRKALSVFTSEWDPYQGKSEIEI